MMRISTVSWLGLLTFACASIIPADCPGRGDEPPVTPQPGGEKPTIKEDDYAIFEVVLLDFLEDKQFGRMWGRGTRPDIVLGVKSAGLTNILGNGPSKDSEPDRIRLERWASLRDRNKGESVDLGGFKPISPKILVRDLSKGTRRPDKDYPTARGYVVTWLPGYSEDGQHALLCASYGPTPHGGTVRYVLTKKDGHWVVEDHWCITYL